MTALEKDVAMTALEKDDSGNEEAGPVSLGPAS
jgi:hypothetical protein